jgi:hypothetical protein
MSDEHRAAISVGEGVEPHALGPHDPTTASTCQPREPRVSMRHSDHRSSASRVRVDVDQ